MASVLHDDMSNNQIHAFCDDVLGDHDAVGLAELVRRGDVSSLELAEAAIARAQRVDEQLNAIQVPIFDKAREQARRPSQGTFAGVPSFIKDNTNVAGLPTRHGSRAVPPTPAHKDGAFTKQYLAQGFILLGKTRLPEFGFNCSTEFQHERPTCNPWHKDYSCGGSSGGSAAMVASGVVPIAHANDGGGSIRIPAACCGLVGLKTTRERFVMHELAKSLPVNVFCDGVVTRSVRDTAHFVAGAELYWRNLKLPAVGLVKGPGKKRLKIGLVYDSLTGQPCPQTRATMERTVALLEGMGHRTTEMHKPVKSSFVDDFVDYWAFLAFMTGKIGKRQFGGEFDPAQFDDFTRGLANRFRKRLWRLPLMLLRLKRTWSQYVQAIQEFDAVLTPVLGHVTPQLGYLGPNVPFEELIGRLMKYAAYTPLNNTNGSPAISLPMGMSREGLPIGIQLAAAHGAERTLLELAYELEQVQPWPRVGTTPAIDGQLAR
ncbi:MAG: amidase [Pirellulaceae bacterium]|nr:amidase [Pirellulaceae bacterium]